MTVALPVEIGVAAEIGQSKSWSTVLGNLSVSAEEIANLVKHYVSNKPNVTWWKNIDSDGNVRFANGFLPTDHGLAVENSQTEAVYNKHAEFDSNGLYVIVASGFGMSGAESDSAYAFKVTLDDSKEYITNLDLVGLTTQQASYGLVNYSSDIFLAEADISAQGETFLRFLPSEAFV